MVTGRIGLWLVESEDGMDGRYEIQVAEKIQLQVVAPEVDDTQKCG